MHRQALILSLIGCVVFVTSAPPPNPPIFKGSTIVATRDAPSTRIVNGKDALPGQFPWLSAIVVDERSFCGGSLISDQWILTAAHCVEGSKYRVIFGTTKWREPGPDSIQLDTTTFTQHEGYDSYEVKNDVAVIKLPKSISFTAFIHPISLSNKALDSGVTVTVSGWGRTSDASQISDVLRYAEMLTITNADCNPFYLNKVTEDMVCATSKGSPVHSACNGDSGGSLVTEASKNPVHVGITSFVSRAGCSSGYPGGFARTAYFRDWIKSKTGV